jgi:hypothetical protein
MRAAISDAGAESVVTYEVCGSPGQHAERRGWWATRCAVHETWSPHDESHWPSSSAPDISESSGATPAVLDRCEHIVGVTIYDRQHLPEECTVPSCCISE